MTKIPFVLILILFLVGMLSPVAGAQSEPIYYVVSYYVVPPATFNTALESGDPYLVDFAGLPVYKALAAARASGLDIERIYVNIDNRAARQAIAVASQLVKIEPGGEEANARIVYIGNLASKPEAFTCKNVLVVSGEGFLAYTTGDGTILYAIAFLGESGQGYHVVTLELAAHPYAPCGESLSRAGSLALALASVVVFVAAGYSGLVWRKRLDREVYGEVSI